MAKHIHVFLLVFCLTDKNENKLSEFVGQFCAEHHRFEPPSTGDFLSISSVLPFTLYCMNSFSYSVFKSSAQAQEVERNEKKANLNKNCKGYNYCYYFTISIFKYGIKINNMVLVFNWELYCEFHLGF